MATKYIVRGVTTRQWFLERGCGSTDDPSKAHAYTEQELLNNWRFWNFACARTRPHLRQVEDS